MLQIEQSIPQIYVRLQLSWMQIEAQNGKTSFESAKGFLQKVATKNHFRGPDQQLCILHFVVQTFIIYLLVQDCLEFHRLTWKMWKL